MALVDTATVKLHCRVDTTDEDPLFTIWITVAEQQVVQFLNRNVYADQVALDAALSGAPAALATATATYDTALAAAYALAAGAERDAAIRYAEEAYARALTASDMATRGMVVNESVKAALLLGVGSLYENRGDGAGGELPLGARSLLQPYRVGMGL
jgi:hypothetical protein